MVESTDICVQMQGVTVKSPQKNKYSSKAHTWKYSYQVFVLGLAPPPLPDSWATLGFREAEIVAWRLADAELRLLQASCLWSCSLRFLAAGGSYFLSAYWHQRSLRRCKTASAWLKISLSQTLRGAAGLVGFRKDTQQLTPQQLCKNITNIPQKKT